MSEKGVEANEFTYKCADPCACPSPIARARIHRMLPLTIFTPHKMKIARPLALFAASPDLARARRRFLGAASDIAHDDDVVQRADHGDGERRRDAASARLFQAGQPPFALRTRPSFLTARSMYAFFQQMEDEGIKANVYTYTAAISACEKVLSTPETLRESKADSRV